MANPAFNVGDVMVIADHINLPGMAGNNPLVGANHYSLGPRFPAMSDNYDGVLRKFVGLAAGKSGMDEKVVKEGVYCFVSGPNYESRAEARFLRMIGSDAVGMSTVPEVVVARHSGIRVIGLALITNKVVTEENSLIPKPTHEEVLNVGKQRARDLQGLVCEYVTLLKNSDEFRDL